MRFSLSAVSEGMTYFALERLLSWSTSSSRHGDLAAEKVDEVHVDKADLVHGTARRQQQQRGWMEAISCALSLCPGTSATFGHRCFWGPMESALATCCS